MFIIPVTHYDFDRQLSDYFKLGEFVSSKTAVKYKIMSQFMEREDVINSIEFLHDNLLLPVRKDFGNPIIITSGFRCPFLNSLVGGSPSSLHTKGLAVDIAVSRGKKDLIEIIKQYDYHELLVHKNYIHLSLKEAFNEKRFRIEG